MLSKGVVVESCIHFTLPLDALTYTSHSHSTHSQTHTSHSHTNNNHVPPTNMLANHDPYNIRLQCSVFSLPACTATTTFTRHSATTSREYSKHHTPTLTSSPHAQHFGNTTKFQQYLHQILWEQPTVVTTCWPSGSWGREQRLKHQHHPNSFLSTHTNYTFSFLLVELIPL